MRFIDDQQIPFGVTQMLQALFTATGKVQRADDQLFGFKRVVGVVLRFCITLIIKQGKTQVEATQHFDQPLVL